MGGETSNEAGAAVGELGPSPRGRGNLAGIPIDMVYVRVHPRVGGETIRTGIDPEDRNGPSPRGRGNQRRAIVLRDDGSTVHPRVGGETFTIHRLQRGTRRVHPRVGGETIVMLGGILGPLTSGPSPRGRGNLQQRSAPSAHRQIAGPSPRGRGNLPVVPPGPSPRGRGNRNVARNKIERSIPAWAGKPALTYDRGVIAVLGSIPAWAGKPEMVPSCSR